MSHQVFSIEKTHGFHLSEQKLRGAACGAQFHGPLRRQQRGLHALRPAAALAARKNIGFLGFPLEFFRISIGF